MFMLNAKLYIINDMLDKYEMHHWGLPFLLHNASIMTGQIYIGIDIG